MMIASLLVTKPENIVLNHKHSMEDSTAYKISKHSSVVFTSDPLKPLSYHPNFRSKRFGHRLHYSCISKLPVKST